ncbi:VanZ family protein [Paenibacillus glycanilyticus]|uniref:VanZ family protein n=1 Tax=Paenibacillus glycanilyticus TaxID=126569 RepID=UPI00203E77F9|nr:VanZ family protein [Paenibacillus glycanilyticus]MCM3626845.1 VanZ family protein [Paenibacillus glycanilyticus]
MKYTKGSILSVLFLFYLYILLKVILFKFSSVSMAYLWQQLHWSLEYPQYMEYGLQRANFTPFESISQNLHRLSDRNDQVNFFGNIAIFLPCGILVGLWTKRSTTNSLLGAATISFGISLALECAQFVFAMGSFDVDDLMLNGLGGLLGWWILFVIRREKALAQV